MSDHVGARPAVQRLVAGIVLCTTTVIIAGCTGYRLGSTLPPGIRSVHVPTFVNKTSEPLLETETTRQTIREFQRDGTLRVANADQADAILEVSLTKFSLQPLRYDPNRPKTTEEYRLLVGAELVFKERRTDKVLSRRKVEGESTFEPTGDISSAKRNALPVAARDLAHDIVESVVEYWY